jgi:hypothetical protein
MAQIMNREPRQVARYLISELSGALPDVEKCGS